MNDKEAASLFVVSLVNGTYMIYVNTLTSSLRSHCVPTRMIGAKGECLRISGTHFSGTF